MPTTRLVVGCSRVAEEEAWHREALEAKSALCFLLLSRWCSTQVGAIHTYHSKKQTSLVLPPLAPVTRQGWDRRGT